MFMMDWESLIYHVVKSPPKCVCNPMLVPTGAGSGRSLLITLSNPQHRRLLPFDSPTQTVSTMENHSDRHFNRHIADAKLFKDAFEDAQKTNIALANPGAAQESSKAKDEEEKEDKEETEGKETEEKEEKGEEKEDAEEKKD